MSEFFEVEYRLEGFGDDELEIFIVHKDADVEHSTIQFELSSAATVTQRPSLTW